MDTDRILWIGLAIGVGVLVIQTLLLQTVQNMQQTGPVDTPDVMPDQKENGTHVQSEQSQSESGYFDKPQGQP